MTAIRTTNARTTRPAPRTSGSLARAVVGVGVTALVGASALFGLAAPAQAAPKPAKTYSGFVASGWAAPVKIEIYDPMIPVPATPQLELEMGYSVVKADSGSSASRGSWLWPGDSIGDGLKTIVEQMGLPPQLGENGYPVQVNSSWPGETGSAKDEPMPGMVMRTSAGDTTTSAEVGFSPDGDIADAVGKDSAKPSAAPSSSGGLLGLPGLPKLPVLGQVLDLTKLPGISDLAAAGQSLAKPGAGNAATPGIPPQLAGLIDFSGYSSKSRTVVSDTQVRTVAQSALGDIRLLGGLIRLEGVTAMQESVSNGKTASSKGESTIGGLVVLGQRFAYTDEGFVLAGTKVAGVPAQATDALKMLGVTITMPQTTTEDEGLRASGLAEGLKIELDAALLSKALRILPLGQLVDLIPDQAGQLKQVAGLLVGLSPRTVITLGNAGTATETVLPMVMPKPGPRPPGDIALEPPGPDTDPTQGPSDTSDDSSDSDTPAGTPTSGDSSGGSTPEVAGLGDVAAPGAPTDPITSPVNDAAPAPDMAPMAAGLPPLKSLPTFLTFLALALASAGGVYLRKAGILALGTGASCTHGLDSGLPDLRKA